MKQIILLLVALVLLVSCAKTNGTQHDLGEFQTSSTSPIPTVVGNEPLLAVKTHDFETYDSFTIETVQGMLEVELRKEKESGLIFLIVENSSSDEFSVQFMLTGISKAMLADLDNDDYDEIIIFNGYDGSNYGAGNIHVFKLVDGGLHEVLTILNQVEENEDLAMKYSSTMLPIHDKDGILHDDNSTSYSAYCTTFPQILQDGDKYVLRINHDNGKTIKGIPYSDIEWNGASFEVTKQGFMPFE